MKQLLSRLLSGFFIVTLNLSAFDNEIVIYGEVLDEVSIDILHLSSDKDGLYLHSNSNDGATVIVRNIIRDTKQQIYQNGKLLTLPISYDLFDGPFVLGSSPFENKTPPTLIIDIKAH